ncbi:hypothetical protein I553_8245 [Mycobacterium xenopi 4042]|uniref:Uncharacterized protein n=1 Tax=Mycobacterium xenopi 4042 TaxID=1299334 RepID=X8BKB8_MYCXE|nr:hypothetical protein I553_8245 [Mycobacterium xenopi 4042]
MNVQGHQIFVDELARFADEAGEPRLTAMAQRIAAPLRVAVDGRRGLAAAQSRGPWPVRESNLPHPRPRT